MKLIEIRNKPNLYRHPKTGIIYFKMFRKGLGQCERSTGETVIARAEVKAEEIRREFLGEKFAKRKGRQLFEDEWPGFLAIKKNKSKRTYESIELQGRLHLLPFFYDKWPHEINESMWEQYIAQSVKKSPTRKIFNDWKYLNMFLHYLRRDGKLASVPKLRNPDPERKKGKVYSDDEVTALLAHAEPELKLQIKMAVTMGMRKSEILLLSWDRVDTKRRVIHLRAEDTKIRKARSFAISSTVWDQLEPLAAINASPYVFPSPLSLDKPVTRDGNKTAWTACKRRAKVTGRFHDLRHTFLTKAFKKTVNPALICEYAGLSLEEAQRTYLHFTVEDTRPVANLVVFE